MPVPLIVPILGAVSTLGGGALTLWGNNQKRKMQQRQQRFQREMQKKLAEEAEKERQFQLEMIKEQQKLQLLAQQPQKKAPYLAIAIVFIILFLLWKSKQ